MRPKANTNRQNALLRTVALPNAGSPSSGDADLRERQRSEQLNCLSRVRTVLAIDDIRFGLHRALRKIRHAFSRATPRSTGARAADRMEYERQRRLMNDNPGPHKPRAKPSVVVNSDLRKILDSVYLRDVREGAKVTGDGTVTTAVIQELNTGQQVNGKWHLVKGMNLMRRLAELLDNDRLQKMHKGTDLLTEEDRAGASRENLERAQRQRRH